MPVATLDVVAGGATDCNHDISLNLGSGDIALFMGDNGTLAGPEERRSMAFIYDAATIPKNAIIEGVKLIIHPTESQSASGGDADHRFALLSPDGGWNRSSQSAIHASSIGSAPLGLAFGVPALGIHMRAKGFTSTGGAIFDINTAGAGFVDYATSILRPTLGSTFLQTASDIIKHIDVTMRRMDAESSDLLQLSVYMLNSNNRNAPVSSHLLSTPPMLYSVLSEAYAQQRFTFIDAGINPTGSPRWLAFCITGDLVNQGLSINSRRFEFQGQDGDSDLAYRVATEGSAFSAAFSDVPMSLSTVGYATGFDVPHIYTNNSTSLLTTPFQRHVGNVLESSDESVSWISGTNYNYGSPSSGQLNELPGIVAELQAYIDSDAFEPVLGKSKIGFMVTVLDPNDLLWQSAGPAHATQKPMKLQITYRIDADMTLESFGVEPSFTAESFGVEQSFTAESMATGASFTDESEDTESSFTDESEDTEPNLTGFKDV